MIAVLASASGALLAWAPTVDALPTPPADSTVRELSAWDAPPPMPYVWSPAHLDWMVPPDVRVGWAPLTFRWRYSPEEQVALELSAWGTAGPYSDEQRATLRIIEKSLNQVQTQVYPDDPRTLFGVNTHVALGLLTEVRAAEILNPAWLPPWAPVE